MSNIYLQLIKSLTFLQGHANAAANEKTNHQDRRDCIFGISPPGHYFPDHPKLKGRMLDR